MYGTDLVWKWSTFKMSRKFTPSPIAGFRKVIKMKDNCSDMFEFLTSNTHPEQKCIDREREKEISQSNYTVTYSSKKWILKTFLHIWVSLDHNITTFVWVNQLLASLKWFRNLENGVKNWVSSSLKTSEYGISISSSWEYPGLESL